MRQSGLDVSTVKLVEKVNVWIIPSVIVRAWSVALSY